MKVRILQFLWDAVIFSLLAPKISVVVSISSAVISVFLPQCEVKYIFIISTIIRKVLFHVLRTR